MAEFDVPRHVFGDPEKVHGDAVAHMGHKPKVGSEEARGLSTQPNRKL